MPRLKEETCRPGAALKNMFSAWEARLVKRFINNFRVVTWNGREPYIDRSDPFGEYTIYIPRSSGGATFPWSKLAFGYSLSGTTCTIYGGSIRIARVGTYAVGETNVTLSGAVVWIYVRHAYDHGETTIEVSATEPSGSTDYMEFPLYNFVRNAGGAYELSRICNMGDIVGYAGIK